MSADPVAVAARLLLEVAEIDEALAAAAASALARWGQRNRRRGRAIDQAQCVWFDRSIPSDLDIDGRRTA